MLLPRQWTMSLIGHFWRQVNGVCSAEAWLKSYLHGNKPFNIFLGFDTSLKSLPEALEGFPETLVIRFRTSMIMITTDWSSRTSPKHLLERRWLKLTTNAFADGQWLNEYVSVRDGSPYLTNNLQIVPTGKVEKVSFEQLIRSRIVQCK